jgi:hypothetical protein
MVMPIVKIRRDEMEIVKQAAIRVERRSNAKFVMDQSRVEVTDEGCPPQVDTDEDDSEPAVVCD